MLVDLTTTAGQNFVKKCIWNKYSNEGTTRTLSLYARFFFWDVNGQYTNEEGFKYNSIVFDQSSIKSFNFTSSLGSSDKFTVGNFPVTTLSLSVFTNSLIEFGESGGGIEIYFSPFQSGSGLSSYLESLSPGKKISATYSDYVVRLGTFYQTNYSYAPYTNVQTFEAVDYLGRPGLADTPYYSSLAYPATLLDITVEAIRLAGFETVNGISSFNIGDITVNEAPEGYTCKDIISMAASCAGANVKKVNRFYDDPVPGGGSLYDSNYDSYIAFVYPSGMEYSDIPPGTSIFNAIDMNHLAIVRTMDIYSESGNDGDHNAPIEAVRYCGVKANYTPIYEDKYGNSLDISSNPFFDSLGSAALATKLYNIAKLYVTFPFMPGTIKTNSCFAFECGDFVEQRFYVNGIYDHGRFHILTSINISSMSTMSVKSPGKYERDTSETGSNTQSQTTRAMQAGQISKLKDSVTQLYDGLYFKPGDTYNTKAIGSTLYAGYLTNNKQFYVSFVLPKRLSSDITGIAVSNVTGSAAGTNGALDGSSSSTYSWGSAYTIVGGKTNDHIIRLSISKSTAFSNAGANATPLTFFGGCTFTFT